MDKSMWLSFLAHPVYILILFVPYNYWTDVLYGVLFVFQAQCLYVLCSFISHYSFTMAFVRHSVNCLSVLFCFVCWSRISVDVGRPVSPVMSRWRRGASYPCSRKTAQLSCIVGCYGCATTYGRHVYDMAACCRQCQLTQAEIIDVGPERCSAEFIIAPAGRKLPTNRHWWWREATIRQMSPTYLLTDVTAYVRRMVSASN